MKQSTRRKLSLIFLPYTIVSAILLTTAILARELYLEKAARLETQKPSSRA